MTGTSVLAGAMYFDGGDQDLRPSSSRAAMLVEESRP